MKIDEVRDLCSERHCRLLRYEEGCLALLELQSTEKLLVSMGKSSLKVFRRRTLFGWFAPVTLLSIDLIPLGWNECIPMTRLLLSVILTDGALNMITKASSIREVIEKYGENFSELLTKEMEKQFEKEKEHEINTESKTTTNDLQKIYETESLENTNHEDNSKDIKINEENSLIKRPRKYGWGWIIVLWVIAANTNHPFTDYDLSMIWNFSFLFLILYFALRKRSLTKWKFFPLKPWQSSFIAGVCTCIMLFIFFFIMLVLDTRLMDIRVAPVVARYKDKAEFFKKEQGKYQAKLIYEPKTTTDINQNIKTIDEILQYENTKQQFYENMYNDYKIALKGKMHKKSKKPYGEVIDNIKSQLDNASLKQKKALNLLRDYYVTGNEKSYQEYTTINQEAQQLINDYQKLLKETFSW